MHLILLPIVGLFIIKFNGYRVWEVKKHSDQPVKQGWVRGNKNSFKVGHGKYHILTRYKKNFNFLASVYSCIAEKTGLSLALPDRPKTDFVTSTPI